MTGDGKSFLAHVRVEVDGLGLSRAHHIAKRWSVVCAITRPLFFVSMMMENESLEKMKSKNGFTE